MRARPLILRDHLEVARNSARVARFFDEVADDAVLLAIADEKLRQSEVLPFVVRLYRRVMDDIFDLRAEEAGVL